MLLLKTLRLSAVQFNDRVSAEQQGSAF